MCGITGIMVPEIGGLDQSALRKMTATIAHRGPDGDGFYFGQKVGLGHRRLSIIDIEGGQQPMACESRQVILTYNGEVYNFAALMAELEQAGASFRGHSDTEVILTAIDTWGLNRTLQRLNGMFAFILWDRKERTHSTSSVTGSEKSRFISAGPETHYYLVPS